MTCNKTLLGHFVATGYPAATMLFVSFLLWLAGALRGVGCAETLASAAGLSFVGDIVARILSLVAFLATAFVLNHIYIFERRVPFLVPLFLWFAAAFMFLHADYVASLSLIPFILTVAQLFYSCGEQGGVRPLFGAFAMLSFASLFLLQFAFLLLPLLLFVLFSRGNGVREFFVALLGVAAPYWLLFGAVYIFPQLDWLLLPLRIGWISLVTPAAITLSPLMCAVLAVEVLVWVVAVCFFFTSSSPAKPLLRRRLLFVILLNLFMWLLAWVLPQDFFLLLAWRLPGAAIMASYVFAIKVTRLANIYFIVLNTLLIFIAACCLWIG